jgi:uncharacterized protein YchJ
LLTILAVFLQTAIAHYDVTHQGPAISPAEMQQMIHEAAREAAARQPDAKPGRNDPCPCGSGKKYKRCHGR